MKEPLINKIVPRRDRWGFYVTENQVVVASVWIDEHIGLRQWCRRALSAEQAELFAKILKWAAQFAERNVPDRYNPYKLDELTPPEKKDLSCLFLMWQEARKNGDYKKADELRTRYLQWNRFGHPPEKWVYQFESSEHTRLRQIQREREYSLKLSESFSDI